MSLETKQQQQQANKLATTQKKNRKKEEKKKHKILLDGLDKHKKFNDFYFFMTTK